MIAYKCDNRSWAIQGEAVLVVDDVNDNSPTVDMSPTTIRIMEETYLTLPISKLIVDDIDLVIIISTTIYTPLPLWFVEQYYDVSYIFQGVHATYSVSLNGGRTTIDYAKPFLMIPDNGYKEAYFTITIANASLLDYEVAEWRVFDLTVIFLLI